MTPRIQGCVFTHMIMFIHEGRSFERGKKITHVMCNGNDITYRCIQCPRKRHLWKECKPSVVYFWALHLHIILIFLYSIYLFAEGSKNCTGCQGKSCCETGSCCTSGQCACGTCTSKLASSFSNTRVSTLLITVNLLHMIYANWYMKLQLTSIKDMVCFHFWLIKLCIQGII